LCILTHQHGVEGEREREGAGGGWGEKRREGGERVARRGKEARGGREEARRDKKGRETIRGRGGGGRARTVRR
jgi:hypothetical protein